MPYIYKSTPVSLYEYINGWQSSNSEVVNSRISYKLEYLIGLTYKCEVYVNHTFGICPVTLSNRIENGDCQLNSNIGPPRDYRSIVNGVDILEINNLNSFVSSSFD